VRRGKHLAEVPVAQQLAQLEVQAAGRAWRGV
jgi:hypothetical protein